MNLPSQTDVLRRNIGGLQEIGKNRPIALVDPRSQAMKTVPGPVSLPPDTVPGTIPLHRPKACPWRPVMVMTPPFERGGGRALRPREEQHGKR